MVTVSKSLLKSKMLEYFRQVEETGEELIVTDNGIPVVKVVPFQARVSVDEAFGDVRGRIAYREDVVASTTEEWDET